MPKIIVQFHAEPTELLSFAESCAEQFQLHAALIRYHPKLSVFEVSDGAFETAFGNLKAVNMVAFSVIPFSLLPAESTIDFMDKNPDSLVLKIGSLTDDGLVESVLSARTDDPASLRVWKEVVKKLRELTFEGAWIVNPETGASNYSKKRRYTMATKELEKNGTKMLPIAGWNFFVLGKERPPHGSTNREA